MSRAPHFMTQRNQRL